MARSLALIGFAGIFRAEAMGPSLSAQKGAWDAPVFLYYSAANDDVALLSGVVPSSVPNRSSYTRLLSDPVAYVSSSESAAADAPLTAYYSPSRGDIQTTEESLDELNKKGGDYQFLSTLGYVASDALSSGAPPHGSQVPVYTQYDADRSDSSAGPLNAGDLNVLFASVGGDFKQKHLVGYAAKGSCAVCNTSLSEAWPSDGGADCSAKCSDGRKCHSARYGLDGIDSPAGIAFRDNMLAAGEIMKKYGDVDPKTDHFHMSLNYLCCLTPEEFVTVNEVFDQISWPEINVTFDKPLYRIDGPEFHWSVIVMLDADSEARMQKWVAEVEDKIQAAGVKLSVLRRSQEPFHVTLAVVDGESFPNEAALLAINEAILPGTWTGSGPLTVKTVRRGFMLV